MSKLRSCATALLILLLFFGLCHASAVEATGPEDSAEEASEPDNGKDEEESVALLPLPPMPEVGEAAPPFEVLSVEGKTYSLKKETDGKVVSLVFWSLFCAPCRRSMPILNDLYRELSDKDFEVVAVNMDGDGFLEGIKSYVTDEQLEFPVVMDEYDGESMKVADPYGVQGTPTTFLIDRGGLVVFSRVGDLERDEMKDLVMRELEGRPHEEKEAE